MLKHQTVFSWYLLLSAAGALPPGERTPLLPPRLLCGVVLVAGRFPTSYTTGMLKAHQWNSICQNLDLPQHTTNYRTSLLRSGHAHSVDIRFQVIVFAVLKRIN